MSKKQSLLTQQPWIQKGNPGAGSELGTSEQQSVLFCKIPPPWSQPYPYHCDG